jgi:hypothetical protein
METLMLITSHPHFCKGVQAVDAVTCFVADGLLTPGASITDGLSTFPPALLFAIGLCLLPIALLIAFIKTRRTVAPAKGCPVAHEGRVFPLRSGSVPVPARSKIGRFMIDVGLPIVGCDFMPACPRSI